MKILNLSELMISLSDFKSQLSEIVSNKKTKVILKNNEPVSVIMPYDEYVALNENVGDTKKLLKRVGQDITLNNDVQVMVCVELGTDKYAPDDMAVKTYLKMKTSGDYKLHHTLHLSPPSIEQTLTIEELMDYYKFKPNED